MKSFTAWIYGFAAAIGGPGLFAIAFLDSSFASLPQINDILVVLMVTQNKAWMLYYAAMATTGSAAKFLGQNIVAGKALCEHGAAHVLTLQIDLCHQVVLSLLGDPKTRLPSPELNLTGTRDDLDGRGEES